MLPRGAIAKPADLVARLVDGASVEDVRGPKQREALGAIANAGATGVRVDDLKTKIEGASAVLKSLASRGLIAIEAAPTTHHGGAAAEFDLTDEQQVALDAIAPAIEHRRYEAFLLWGVTASGKTEIYLNLAARALAAGRNVLIMVPEIALADEIVRSFRARFGSLVGIAHSAQSVTERWASWMAAIGGHARVMIGPRSVIFAPMHDIGLDRRRRGARRVVQERGRDLLSRTRSRSRTRGIFTMSGRAGLRDAVERVVRKCAAWTLPAAAPFAARE